MWPPGPTHPRERRVSSLRSCHSGASELHSSSCRVNEETALPTRTTGLCHYRVLGGRQTGGHPKARALRASLPWTLGTKQRAACEVGRRGKGHRRGGGGRRRCPPTPPPGCVRLRDALCLRVCVRVRGSVTVGDMHPTPPKLGHSNLPKPRRVRCLLCTLREPHPVCGPGSSVHDLSAQVPPDQGDLFT